jgi:hypothetical protein
MKKFDCVLCGKKFDNSHGMMVHLHTCRKKHGFSPDAPLDRVQLAGGGKRKNGKNSRLDNQRAEQSDPNRVFITVPCDLGGNKFNVEIALSIAGTNILPV